MSRPRDRCASYPPEGTQRDASSPPALLLCSAPPSQSTPLRVFGTEITNRTPTPPPPQTFSSMTAAPLDAETSTLCGSAVDAPLTRTLLEPVLSCSWQAAGPYRCDSSRNSAVEHIPSFETLLGAICGVDKREGSPPQAVVRSPSFGSSNVSFGILFPLRTADGGGQSRLEIAHDVASAPTEASVLPAPNAKRRLRSGDLEDGGDRARSCSSGPQAKRQRSEGVVVGGLTGAFSTTAPLLGRPASPVEAGGVGGRSDAGSICSGGEADDHDARPAILTFSSEDGGDARGFLTPVPRKLLCLPPVELVSRPPSQRIHARACRPARLLDREHATPTWQVLTSAPTMPEAEGDELDRLASTSSNAVLFSGAWGNMLLRNAADSTLIHSPSTLDDISPILCLSGERLGRCRVSAVTCERHLSSEVEDEEQRADDALVSAALSTPPRPFRALMLTESGGDEEDMWCAVPNLSPQRTADDASFIHKEALRLLTFTCEDVHDDSMRWPG